ncbi:sulfatase [Myxococcota bacterium]|nr:sulfatase [Myxococcota bacterium]
MSDPRFQSAAQIRVIPWRGRRGLCVALLLLLAGGCGSGPSPAPERVVLIVIDTLRRDHLGAYGGSADTPHLDALAERGQVFTNAQASFHQTSMSMGALFTGRVPSIESRDVKRTLSWNDSTWCGLARLAEDAGESMCVPHSLTTLAELFAESGYWTIGVASNDFLYRPAGFDAGFADWTEVGRVDEEVESAMIAVPEEDENGRVVGRPRRIPLVSGNRVNAAVRAALERRPSDRFFLYVHYMDVHDYSFRRMRYAKAVERVDSFVGGLLAELEGLGFEGRTSVILTSDHGERLGDVHALEGGGLHNGNPSFQEVLDVPLIIVPPAGIFAGREEALVRSHDLMAWISELAGLAPPDFDPVLQPDELFVGEQGYRTYRAGRFKSVMDRRSGRFYLFDLDRDPGETLDIADRHPDVIRRHLVRTSDLARELSSVNEPQRGLSPEERRRLRLLGYLE